MPNNRPVQMNRSAMRSLKFFAELASAVLIIFILYAARDVLIPITLSVLLAFLLSPVVNWFQKRGLNNITAVVLTASGLFAILLIGLVLMGSSIAEFAKDYPKYKGEITKKVDTIKGAAKSIGERLDSAIASSLSREDAAEGTSESPTEEESDSNATASNGSKTSENLDAQPHSNSPFPKQDHLGIQWQNYLGSIGTVFGPIGTAGLVAVFALFLLIYRDDLRDRFVAVISRGNYVVTTEAMAEASERISKYITAQFLLNSAYGILFGIGLWIIGLVAAPSGSFPNLMFFTVLAGLVRFLPYVGPLIGAGVPLLISIAVFPGYTVFIAVLALIVSMELISNNIVEPWLYGSRTGVSAIGVIIAAVFWGWLWGGVGLLLATPLTVCLVVLGRYVPRMKYFATLLSDQEQVAPSLRSYQRLLSNDEHKLRESLVEQIKKREPLEFLDEVVVPLAKRILRQPSTERPTPTELTTRLRSVLQQDQIKNLLVPAVTSTEEAKASTSEGENEMELPPPPKPEKVFIVTLGSRVMIEELLLSVFSDMHSTYEWHAIEAGELPDLSTKEIIDLNPHAVLILSLPPGGIQQTQFWCKALRRDGFQRDIIVLRPAKMRRYHDLFVLLRKAGANSLTTSFTQTRKRLQAIRIPTARPETRNA